MNGKVQQNILSRLTYGKNNGMFIRLSDFIDAAAGQGFVELMDKRAHGKAIKTHGKTPFG